MKGVGPPGARASNGCDCGSWRTALETLAEAARAITSDGAAFDDLVERTGAGLVRYAARILGNVSDAEDAVQESYVKAYDALVAGRFDGRSSLKTWLYRIVTRTAIDHRRSRARRERPTDVAEGAMTGGSNADAHLALRELEELLEELPEAQRTTLLLQAMEGFSNREIAEIIGASEGAVEQRLVRARATLLRKLEP